MSVVLSEHLPLLTAAPDGIQKLRRLILELAVRGKLVPQDPNDEPASELLKRIAKERVSQNPTATRKKSKHMPPLADEDWPYALPDSWEWSRLSDLTQVLNGRAYAKDELLDSGTPVLRVGNLFTSNQWYYSNLSLEPDKYCDKGDLIYSWSASFGPFIWNGPKVIYHYHIWKLALYEETSYSKEFLYKFLLEKTAEIKAAGHGVSMVHMTKEKMERIPVPIPPLAEQHRIVSKVDELMALCDRLEAEQMDAEAAHARLVETLLDTLTQSTDATELATNWQRLAEHFDTLFTTESSLDALKQTILQLAVMGKLVPQDPDDEPASELLKRIAKERARLEAEGFCKKTKTMPLINADEQPFELPENWQWVRFGAIANTRLGKMLDVTKNRGVLKPYLRNSNVQWFRFDLNDVKELRLAPDELEEFRLEDGDLLICEGGEPGRCAIWRSAEEEMYFQKALHRARPNGGILAEYLQITIRQDAVSGALGSHFTGATIKHFPGDKLIAYVIPLPPVKEQHRIVAKVDELTALCDRLKADLVESRSRQARLSATLIESALQTA